MFGGIDTAITNISSHYLIELKFNNHVKCNMAFIEPVRSDKPISTYLNSLASGRFEWNFTQLFSKLYQFK